MAAVLNGGCVEESRLRLCFDDSWRVLAFDKSRWFRHLTGMGFKGVDFICLRGKEVILLEVKNFRRPGAGRVQPDMVALEEAIDRKFKDSERLAGIVLGTLERYLLFRVWRWLARRLRWFRRMEPEWTFWYDVVDRLEQGQVIRSVMLAHAPEAWSYSWPRDWMVMRPGNVLLPGLNLEEMGG